MSRELCNECNGFKTLEESGMCVECSQHLREELMKESGGSKTVQDNPLYTAISKHKIK